MNIHESCFDLIRVDSCFQCTLHRTCIQRIENAHETQICSTNMWASAYDMVIHNCNVQYYYYMAILNLMLYTMGKNNPIIKLSYGNKLYSYQGWPFIPILTISMAPIGPVKQFFERKIVIIFLPINLNISSGCCKETFIETIQRTHSNGWLRK